MKEHVDFVQLKNLLIINKMLVSNGYPRNVFNKIESYTRKMRSKFKMGPCIKIGFRFKCEKYLC